MTIWEGIQYLTGVCMILGCARSFFAGPAAFAKLGIPKPPLWLHVFFLAWGVLALVLPTDVYIKVCLPLVFIGGFVFRRWARLPSRPASPSA
ncbi:MAG: hypothetical protein JNL50_11130 [Phycisphaerae bacterium]|nr:hypothetical protein [Phycisphaerae bacterium]